jgi:hypothetical protein
VGWGGATQSWLPPHTQRAALEPAAASPPSAAMRPPHPSSHLPGAQVLDTPGILDRPLEDRNTIEMQSVTALAHLRAAVLYLVDVSEACGYTLAQQVGACARRAGPG